MFNISTNADANDGNHLAKASVALEEPLEKSSSNEAHTVRNEAPLFRVKCATVVYDGPDCYHMLSPTRGICLLINNIKFTDESLYRQGSDVEGHQLAELFTQLGFTVRYLQNQTAKQMNEAFDAVACDENHRSYDAFVAIILSHGVNDNIILGTDSYPVFLDSILTKFNNENCPLLISKPKMFFIQACRGFKQDFGVLKPCASVLGETEFSVAPIPQTIRVPTWTDTLVCNSTCDGFASMRNIITGSWFGDALIKVFCEHARDTELHRLLSLVSCLQQSVLSIIHSDDCVFIAGEHSIE